MDVLDSLNSKCKGSEVEVCLVCVSGAQGGNGEVGDYVRGVP